MTARAEIAAALSGIEGADLHGYEYMPRSVAPGDAWPVVERWAYPNHLGGITTWSICVALSSEADTAERRAEALHDDLWHALSEVAAVTEIRPQATQLPDGQVVHLLVITATRED